MQKNSKNKKFIQNFFLARNNLKALKYVRNTICEVSDEFQARNSQKELSDLSKKMHDPGYAKKLKNEKFIQNLFLARNNLKSFKYIRNTICEVSNEFQARNSQKRT